MTRNFSTRLLLALCCWLLLFCAAAFASVRSGAVTVAPMAGYQGFDGALELEDAEAFGLSLGYNLSRHWAVEADLRYAPTEPATGGGDVDVFIGTVNTLYHFTPQQTFVPYAAFGVGGLHYARDSGNRNDDDLIANWGGGFKFSVARDLDLRVDLRHILDFRNDNAGPQQDDGKARHQMSAMFAMNLQLGGHAEVPVRSTWSAPLVASLAVDTTGPATEGLPLTSKPAPPQDSDHDGVVDADDLCPGTAPGVRVDASGCPADTDGDGVPDFLDACLDTPRDVKVDAQGCPETATGDDLLPLDIRFAQGRSEVTPFHYRELDRAAAFARQHPGRQVVVEVAAEDQALAQARAESLRQVLISKHGIAVLRAHGQHAPSSAPAVVITLTSYGDVYLPSELPLYATPFNDPEVLQ